MSFLHGVYWDLDGTLANTELEAHLPAFNKAFKDFGLKWNWDASYYLELLKINGGKNRISYYSKIVNEPLNKDLVLKIHKKKQYYYLDYIKSDTVKLKVGVKRLTRELHNKKVRQFIVTSSSRIQVDMLIQHLFPDFNPFEFVISSDDVKFQKPNPLPYLKAIDLSGIKNNNSLVFEDSNAGIKSALTANLPTIFIPSNIPTTLDENIEIECIVDTLGDEKKMSNVIKGPKLETNYIDHAFLNNYLKLFFHAKH